MMKLPIKIDKNRDLRRQSQHHMETKKWEELLRSKASEIAGLQALLAGAIANSHSHGLQQQAIDYYSDLNYLKKQFSCLQAGLNNQSVNQPVRFGQVQFDQSLFLRNQFTAISNEYGPVKDDCRHFLTTMVNKWATN